MKILFIFKSENFLVPIGLCFISSVAKKEGYSTYLCEMNSQNPLKCISDLRPDVVAYSSSTGEAKHYIRLNQIIKKKFPEVFTIMGGPHPTFYPDLIYNSDLDAICRGEGEYAFVDTLKMLAVQKSVDGIPNIVTRNNIDKMAVRNLVADLDTLPFPDFSLIYDNTPLGKYPLKSIITSRGCPYECTYCFNSAWREIYRNKGKAVRRNSVNYVIDEIKYVKERWPLSFVKFYDDIFTYSADSWLEEFSKKYKKHINLPFFILTRPDLLTEDMVKLLKFAGCRTISMSIEAGNRPIRENMLKRNMTNQKLIDVHKLCDEYGIFTFTNCIIGLPDASIDNDIESIDLAITAKVTWAEFLVFHPYPGTELGERTIEKGYYIPDFENMHTSYQYRSPLNCFTEKEKNSQMNISALGAVAVVFPFLRNLIVRYLIYFPHNGLFTLTYSFIKMRVFRKKIYVTKTNFWISLIIFAKSLWQDWFRHENENG